MLQLTTRFHKLCHIIQKGQPCSSQMAFPPSQNKVPIESTPSKLSLVMQHPVRVSVLLIHSKCCGSTLLPSGISNKKPLWSSTWCVLKQWNCTPFQPSEATPPCIFTEHSKHLPIVVHSLKHQNLVTRALSKTGIGVKVQNHFQKEEAVYFPWEKIHTHTPKSSLQTCIWLLLLWARPLSRGLPYLISQKKHQQENHVLICMQKPALYHCVVLGVFFVLMRKLYLTFYTAFKFHRMPA